MMLRNIIILLFIFMINIVGTEVIANNNILILNVDQVFTDSLVGKNLQDKIQESNIRLKGQKEDAEEKLRYEASQIESQKPVLSDEKYAEKRDKLRLKIISLQEEITKNIRKFETALTEAQTQIFKIMNPILNEILTEKKANVILDRRNVLIGSPDIDITDFVIKKLNDKIKDIAFNIE